MKVLIKTTHSATETALRRRGLQARWGGQQGGNRGGVWRWWRARVADPSR